MLINRNLSLEELENSAWPEPELPSSLIKKCHQLRKMPIGELQTEDLRLLIGQNIGLPYIMPLAIELLFDNPLCAGAFFNGDLLQNVLNADISVWQKNSELFEELILVMDDLECSMELYQNRLKPLWVKLTNDRICAVKGGNNTT